MFFFFGFKQYETYFFFCPHKFSCVGICRLSARKRSNSIFVRSFFPPLDFSKQTRSLVSLCVCVYWLRVVRFGSFPRARHDKQTKFLIFAHHTIVLDALERHILRRQAQVSRNRRFRFRFCSRMFVWFWFWFSYRSNVKKNTFNNFGLSE